MAHMPCHDWPARREKTTIFGSKLVRCEKQSLIGEGDRLGYRFFFFLKKGDVSPDHTFVVVLD